MHTRGLALLSTGLKQTTFCLQAQRPNLLSRVATHLDYIQTVQFYRPLSRLLLSVLLFVPLSAFLPPPSPTPSRAEKREIPAHAYMAELTITF